MNSKDKVVPGTTITESSMEKMLRHNRELVGASGATGPAGAAGTDVDHQKVAEGLLSSQPVLLPGIASPRIRATRITERAATTEGVQGTSPTPGQDSIDYIPPTTSNTADPANIPAKGPDAENQPASKLPTKAEQFMRDIGTLFGEADNPFAKNDKGDGDKDDKEDDGDDKDDKDDKDKDDKDEDEGEPVEETVQVNCESCGYEEVYILSESNIAEGNVPLTAEGKLDNKCPMCGADMDLSMVGATNTGEIGDPNPRTDARGNSKQESVVARALANRLMHRIVAGESVEAVANEVIAGDFMEAKVA